MFRYFRSRRNSGFTLLELIVVMAVIAVLVAMGVPRFIGYTKDAAVTAMKADCKVLEDACMIYNLENDGAWPVLQEGEPAAAVAYTPAGELIALLGDAEAFMIDEALLTEHIRSLKNGFGDYALITDAGTADVSAGEVLYISNSGDGVEGRDGARHFGITLKIDAD